MYTGRRRLHRISWCWCSFLFVVVYLYLFKCVCVSTFSFILRKIPLHFLLIHRMVVLWMFINVEYTTHFMSSWIPLGDHLIHFKVRSFYYVIFFIFQKLKPFSFQTRLTCKEITTSLKSPILVPQINQTCFLMLFIWSLDNNMNFCSPFKIKWYILIFRLIHLL